MERFRKNPPFPECFYLCYLPVVDHQPDWISAKSILSSYKLQNSWFGTEYNMNLYRGCPHGCIYCDSRSSCYGVENFDKVRPKAEALSILEGELKRRRRKGIVAMGAMSDPYNPLEKNLNLTSGAVDLIGRAGFGLALATKSDLICRDIPLIRKVAERAPVLIKITVTTTDESLSTIVEPRAAAPSSRIEAVRQLSAAGLFTGILMMPVLPFLQDNAENVLGVVRRSAQAGARFIFPGFGVTLRDNQRQWYYDRLDESFPGLSSDYQRFFGDRYSCGLPHKVRALEELFRKECDSLGILYRMKDIIEAYKKDYALPEQMEMFE